MPQSGRDTRATLALLGSLCLFLSIIEYLIPKPLPFMRIGLANLPLLLALDIVRPRDFFLLALLKVLGQGIIGGTLFSYIFFFSCAGTFASAAVMFAMRGLLGKKYLGFAGLGCAGALASNGIQLVLAQYVLFGSALRYLAPPFLASGLVTGIALGIFCEYFCRHSVWYRRHAGILPAETAPYAVLPQAVLPQAMPSPATATRRLRRQQRWNTLFRADELLCCGLLMALIFLFGRSVPARAAQFLFFCLLVWFSGRKNNVCVTLGIMAGVILCSLLVPYGKVIAEIGQLRVTQGSLLTGLEKALTLGGLVMLSRACIRADLILPGTIGSLLGESLRMLELMRAKKGLIRRGSVIGGIDRLMLEMEAITIDEPDNPRCREPKRNGKALFLLSAMALLTAAMGFAPV